MNRIQKFNEEFHKFCEEEIIPIIGEYVTTGDLIYIEFSSFFWVRTFQLSVYKSSYQNEYFVSLGINYKKFPVDDKSFADCEKYITFEQTRYILSSWDKLKQKFLSRAKKMAEQKRKDTELSKIKFNLLNIV
jgi:hypothetical protein